VKDLLFLGVLVSPVLSLAIDSVSDYFHPHLPDKLLGLPTVLTFCLRPLPPFFCLAAPPYSLFAGKAIMGPPRNFIFL